MASSRMLALLGLLAVAGYQNRDRLAEMFGKMTGGPDDARPRGDTERVAPGGAKSGGVLGGLLGGLLGNTTMRDIPGGLGDVIDQFKRTGQGEAAKSWVETGPNRPIDTAALESALGQDTIDALVSQTGLARNELLARLQSALPSAVNDLTPDGRLPSETEIAEWVRR
jgi:uncharacterized protein YidB (DUF937 family)